MNLETTMVNFQEAVFESGRWNIEDLRYFLRMVVTLLDKDVGRLPDELSSDDKTALRMARQLISWAAQEPQEVRVVKGKPSITFGTITLGEHESAEEDKR